MPRSQSELERKIRNSERETIARAVERLDNSIMLIRLPHTNAA